MTRIAFIGAGAVGGYFGGLMAAYYSKSNDVEIYFVCRNSTAKNIKANGLILETTHGDYNIHPNLYDESINRELTFEFIICCTKSFDLLESLDSIRSQITNDTIIIPLLNGVDSYDKIKSILPNVEVWDACVYIVSKIIEPGYIKETGGIQLMYFGSRNINSTRLEEFEKLLLQAGIKARLSDNILSTIWEKFLFISTIATMTSYMDKCIGQILANEDYRSEFHSLLKELKMLADAKSIALPDNIFDTVYIKMQNLPFEATSSMHRDFQSKRQTELETLTGIVVKMANELHISVPEYNKMYNSLMERQLE